MTLYTQTVSFRIVHYTIVSNTTILLFRLAHNIDSSYTRYITPSCMIMNIMHYACIIQGLPFLASFWWKIFETFHSWLQWLLWW